MTNFVYDPKRQGYDTTLWKTLSGVPAIVADKLVLKQGSIISYADLYGCDLKMRIIIPAVPTVGDSRQFGFASAALGVFLCFDISGDVFSIYAKDESGNTKSVEVDFKATWAAAAADFEIRWRGTYADFLVNGVKVIDIASADIATYRINDIAVSKGPLSMYLNNANNDNMEVVSINAKNIQTFI